MQYETQGTSVRLFHLIDRACFCFAFHNSKCALFLTEMNFERYPDTQKYNITRKGWCPRTGKGQRFMGKEAVNGNISGYWVRKPLMSQLCWQHA